MAENSTTYRDQLKYFAMTTQRELMRYLTVNDAIFRDGFTFMSFLKNLIGMGVPMAIFLEDSERLQHSWDNINKEMEAFRQSALSSLSKDEKYYFNTLSNYTNAVRKTITALVDRQRLMYKKSMGETMTWKEFHRKEKSYKRAVQEYTKIGQELDSASHIIFR